jgi:hypothetical protein
MSLFALKLPDRRLAGLATRVALTGALAAAVGAMAAQAAVQPQLMKLGVLLICATVLLGLAMSMPPRVLPLALVVGLLGLGNLDLARITGLPILARQEVWVLLLLAGVAVVGAVADLSAAYRPTWPPVLLLGALFLAVSVGSLFYGGDRDLAWGVVAHQVVEMTALAAGFFWVRRVSEAEALVLCAIILALLSATLGLWHYITPTSFNSVFGRFADLTLQGRMDNWALVMGRTGPLWVFAPALGCLLSALLPCFLWLWFCRRGAGLQWLAALGFILCAVALLRTGTRAALVGGAIAILVFLAAWSPPVGRMRRSRWYVVSALVGAVALATVLSGAASEGNALRRMLDLFGEEGRTSASVTVRLTTYGALVDTWKSHPVFGVGLGNTRDDIELLTTYQTSPHSYWLGLLAETGLVGTGLVALMLAAMIPHYRRLLRAAPDSRERAIGVLALAASVAVLVYGVADVGILYAWQIGVLFWLLQGVVLSLTVRCEGGSQTDVGLEQRFVQEGTDPGWDYRAVGRTP